VSYGQRRRQGDQDHGDSRAPAIGVAAAMGIALGMRRSKATGTKQFTTEFQKLCD
jgi:methylthioribose-1-phosphate isomerase